MVLRTIILETQNGVGGVKKRSRGSLLSLKRGPRGHFRGVPIIRARFTVKPSQNIENFIKKPLFSTKSDISPGVPRETWNLNGSGGAWTSGSLWFWGHFWAPPRVFDGLGVPRVNLSLKMGFGLIKGHFAVNLSLKWGLGGHFAVNLSLKWCLGGHLSLKWGLGGHKSEFLMYFFVFLSYCNRHHPPISYPIISSPD